MTLLYGEVTFRGQRIVADSTLDFDALPDAVPLAGYVDFIPSLSVNYDRAEGAVKVIEKVTAGLDLNGILRDGQGNDSVVLVSPLSPDLQHQDWTWLAVFRLHDDIEFGPYTFRVAPGQRKNLANESLLMDTSTTPLEAVDVGDGTLTINGETVFFDSSGIFTASSPIIDSNPDGTFVVNA